MNTDVEGSTSLWEWSHSVAMKAIDMHDRIMRSKMAEFHGFEVPPPDLAHRAGQCFGPQSLQAAQRAGLG